MATGPTNRVLRYVRRALRAGDDRTDAELLERFVAGRDEAAFAALMRRHGPMVLGVCRRTVGHADDADDAFQAAFLVLARKAASIRVPARLGAWLYGVAYRTARKARAAADRLRARERQVQTMPQPADESEDQWQEIAPLLDQELSRLPDKYRIPIILCDLEGGRRKDVARRLGVPEGTLSSRLATGRRMLAGRMVRYGLAVSAGALATVLASRASAAVPAALSAATIQAAASGAAALASAKVVALTDGVIKAMLWTKLKVAAVVLTAGLMLTGAGAAVLGPGKAGAAGPPTADPAKFAADGDSDRNPADGGGKHAAEWKLDFRFHDPRSIQLDASWGGKKRIWYIVYTVANPTDQEHPFVPDFELVANDQQGRHDETLSTAVRETIEQAEDPNGAIGRVHFKSSVTIAADPLPPTKPDAAAKEVTGLATWDDVDPDCDHFSIYVNGLSNAWSIDDKGQVRRKTLRLDFKRGDGGEMRLAGPPQWLYRPSIVVRPGPVDPALLQREIDKLTKQVVDARLVAADEEKDRDRALAEKDKEIADLRRQLEKAKYAAAITDAQKALLQRDDEIAVLRDKLSSAQVQVEALTDRCKALEQKIKELQKAMDNGDGKKDDKPADAPHVEGVVTKATDHLVTISIGRDAGIDKGMTLEVYRLDPPTYLGRLSIIEVAPTASYGKPTDLPGGKTIQAGDRVTNKPLDGK